MNPLKIIWIFIYVFTRTTANAAPACSVNNSVKFVGEGCPCNPLKTFNLGLCSKGYVCAQPWTGSLVRQVLGAVPPAPDTSLMPTNPSQKMPTEFTCQPCTYGQYCPDGSVLPAVDSPYIQIALTSLSCPSGTYCPTPGESYPCQAGSFCAQGSVAPVTCNMTVLVDSYPALIMPSRPTTVYESVYIEGQQMAGNQCPMNSSTPTDSCPDGFYCPTPGEAIICPKGYYCKQGSQNPSKCPSLTNCPEGSSKATLSWFGFIILAGILLTLWVSYLMMITVLRMNQRKLARTQTARERLWKLLNPLFASQNHSKSQSFRAFKAIRPKITIEFENLGLTLRDGHSILSGVSGKFVHSRVAAIMGPSGAGKSTFLNVIMGKASVLGSVSGGIRVNGREMKPEELKGIVGFVPQEDIVHEDLTVRENLVYSARLRLSSAKPLKEQLTIVDDVINVLQLRHVQHNVVGSAERRGISGGQRKRVNIGMELVAKPSVLFMDEPTSGLDATAAADILSALKRMAGLGMNIITVIHQPRFSIFSLFDDVMLLCKGGKLAYLGPSHLALPYFEAAGFVLPINENPADFAMDVLSGSVPRTGYPNFQPEDMVPLWESPQGAAWVKSHDALPASISTPVSGGLLAVEAVDPEQLRLLEEAFDAADSDGDEAIDGDGMKTMLQSLGLEPTAADISMIVTELAEPRSGLIHKPIFMQYVRYGGRPPTADAPNGTSPNRRVDSLYRVYSIEQYTLGNALSELAASQLPAAMKLEPSSATLKGMAAASMEMNVAPTARKDTMTRMAGPDPIIEGVEGDDSVRTGSTSSFETYHLPDSTTDSTNSTSSSTDSPKKSVGGGDDDSSMGPAFSRHGSVLHIPASDAMTLQLRDQGMWSRFMYFIGLGGGTGSLRTTPSVLGQLYILLIRASIKWSRNWTVRFTDLLLLIAAAIACGAMHGTGSVANDVRGQSALVLLTLGVLSASTSLSVFGKDKLVFWRESGSGIGVLPYFLANTGMNILDIALHPLVFLAIYTSMTLPTITFASYYIIGVLVVWWTASAGCLISVVVNNQANALVAAVAVVMICGGFINGVNPNYRDMNSTTKKLTSLSYNRWAVEAVVISSYEHYPQYMWPLTKALVNYAGYCGLDTSGIPSLGDSTDVAPTVPSSTLEQQDITIYCAGYYKYALVVLFLEGLVLRLATLLTLYCCPRGFTLEPIVVAFSTLWKKLPRPFKRKVRRGTTVGTSGAV